MKATFTKLGMVIALSLTGQMITNTVSVQAATWGVDRGNWEIGAFTTHPVIDKRLPPRITYKILMPNQSEAKKETNNNINIPTHGIFQFKINGWWGEKTKELGIIGKKPGPIDDYMPTRANNMLYHVETQAAALLNAMAKRNQLLHNKALLLINFATGPCNSCKALVPKALHNNNTLTVVWAENSSWWTTIYKGVIFKRGVSYDNSPKLVHHQVKSLMAEY